MELSSQHKKLIEDARNSICSFCIEECKAYCCRKGYILVTSPELKEMTNGKDMGKRVSTLTDERNVLSLSPGCPSLDGVKCSIYKSENRPPACHDYPIFIEDNHISFSPRCLAVKEGKFYPLIVQLKNAGYTVKSPKF